MNSIKEIPKLPDPQFLLPTVSTQYTPPSPSLSMQPPKPSLWGTLRTIRKRIREPMAEFLGVAVFVIFGAGGDCSVVLSTDPKVTATHKGEFLSTNLGWAIGLGMGIWISAGYSEGHVNPAITLVMATRRKFPWKKVPEYIFAQVMGGVVGAALTYAQYIHAIDIFEGGRHIRTQATAGLFSSFALDYLTQVSCFFSEFLGCAILAFMIIVATDKNNKAAPPVSVLPFLVFLTMLGLGISLGMQTSFAFNPARDLGPRLFLSMAGYGKEVYTFRNQYWIWCTVMGPILGAQCSVALYDIFLYDAAGANSPDSTESDAQRVTQQSRIHVTT